MDIVYILLLAISAVIPAYVLGSVLAYLLNRWCFREMPKPILRKMFWDG